MSRNKKIIIALVSLFLLLAVILIIILIKKPITSIKIGRQDVSIVDNGSGLYIDEFNNKKYIYRGNDPKNYVKFNGDIWRILSVDNEGNIQIILNDVLNARPFDSKGNRDKNSSTPAGSYCKEAYEGCNAFAANEHVNGKPKNITNGNFLGEVTEDSEILTYLNGEYLKSLPSKYIISHDFSIGGADLYATMKQLVTTEGRLQWNGKVGLITVSDYLKASTGKKCDTIENVGANYTNCSQNNWMYLNGKTWTTASSHLNSSTYLWYIDDEGYMNGMPANEAHGIRPTLYLSSDVVFKGDGSSKDPFQIV